MCLKILKVKSPIGEIIDDFSVPVFDDPYFKSLSTLDKLVV